MCPPSEWFFPISTLQCCHFFMYIFLISLICFAPCDLPEDGHWITRQIVLAPHLLTIFKHAQGNRFVMALSWASRKWTIPLSPTSPTQPPPVPLRAMKELDAPNEGMASFSFCRSNNKPFLPVPDLLQLICVRKMNAVSPRSWGSEAECVSCRWRGGAGWKWTAVALPWDLWSSLMKAAIGFRRGRKALLYDVLSVGCCQTPNASWEDIWCSQCQTVWFTSNRSAWNWWGEVSLFTCGR